MKNDEMLKIKSDWLYYLTTYGRGERDIKRPFSPFDWQRDVLSKVFERENGRLRHRICGLSTPRQVGKSLVGIRIAQVYMSLVPDSSVIIINSASEDSATQTIFNRLKNVLRNQKLFKRSFKFRKSLIENTELNCKAEVLSAEKLDVLGRTANCVIFDELWHLRPEKWALWSELLPSIATMTDRDAQVIAVSTAGPSNDPEQPMMNLYNHYVAKDMPELYFYYSTDAHISPLITPQSLAMQKKLMTSAYFKRNWLNQIGIHGESALEKADIDNMLSPDLVKVHKSSDATFIGIDLGLKKDLTALAIVGVSGKTYVLRHLRYWKPSKGRELNFDEFESAVEETLKAFPSFMSCDFDAYQSFRTVQKLKARYRDRVSSILFSSNYKKEILQNLIVMIKSGRFKVYGSGDEIEVLKRQFEGLVIDADWNSTHGKDGDDLIIAIAMALKKCVAVFPTFEGVNYGEVLRMNASTPDRESTREDIYLSPATNMAGRLTRDNQW